MTDDPLELDGQVEEPDAENEPRRYPSTIGGAFYIVILLACIGGVVLVSTGRWRLGIQVVAGALVVASGLRLLLPNRDAGMLAVRHRAVDVTLLAGLGGLLYFLAVSIPNQPD